MWQRIQTIFLLLAAASNFVMLVPAMTFSSVSALSTEGIMADGKFNVYDFGGMQWLLGLAAGASLAAIFLFRNRSLQTKVTFVAGVVAVALLGFAVGVLYRNHFSPNGLAWIGPIAAMVFNGLAIRGIRKDEKTVRSMDRLR